MSNYRYDFSSRDPQGNGRYALIVSTTQEVRLKARLVFSTFCDTFCVQNRIFLEWSGSYAHINETCFRLLPSGQLTGRYVLVLKFAPHFEKSWLAVLFFLNCLAWLKRTPLLCFEILLKEIQTLCIFCMVCWPSIILVRKQSIETFWLTYAWYVGWHNPIM